MATKTKTYDTVAEVRQVRNRLVTQMTGMSPSEQVSFVRKQLEQAKKAQHQDSES